MQEHKPDIIFVDYQLDDGDQGGNIVEAIMAMSYGPLIVAISGGKEFNEDMISRGAEYAFSKPFVKNSDNFNALVALIKTRINLFV